MYLKSGPWLLVGMLAIASAQQGSAPAPPQVRTSEAPAPNVAETVTKEEPATFKTRVNLVMVPVVVRDKQGRAVGNLRQEDFQLFDRGKPQVITRFSIESAAAASAAAKAAGAGKPKAEDAGVVAPERFIAYLFDDIHLSFSEIAYARNAAGRHIDTSLLPTDRAAIYTTSGQTSLEFTDDRDQLHAALQKLMPRPILGPQVTNCPDISYFMADQIQNHEDPIALQGAIQDAIVCAHLPDASSAESMVRSEASRVIAMGSQETLITIAVLRDIVRRMSGAPGQRTIVLASPGFLNPDQKQDESEIIDRAIKAQVTISALDARGLYVEPGFDASQRTFTQEGARIKQLYDSQAARAQADVLAEFASGTGGGFFQNSNDLGEGYRRLASAPEYLYLLGFAPQNLKLDGSFHGLKVNLQSGKGLTLEARKGYYAPRHLNDAEETAREEISEALFSREELRELPAEIHTQFFKPSDDTARLTVVVHLGLRNLKFRKEEGRNRDNVTVVSALFDRNGNFLNGTNKVIEMRLKDETMVQRIDAGFTVRSTFDVKPGQYLIRLVVRDSEGQLMAAQNGAVEIP
jgi:VWFA-related protein